MKKVNPRKTLFISYKYIYFKKYDFESMKEIYAQFLANPLQISSIILNDIGNTEGQVAWAGEEAAKFWITL